MLARRSPRNLLLSLTVFTTIFPVAITHAQAVVQEPTIKPGSSPRTWSIFTEYSPGSSAIILGYTNQREFVTVGAAFTQRLFRNRIWALDYRAEIRPLIAESDPVLTGNYYNVDLPPIAGFPGVKESGYVRLPHERPVLSTARKVENYTFTYNGQTYYQDYTFTYGRRWTYVGGLSPLGLEAKFLPQSKIQPVLTLMTGFAVSPRDIPMFDSSAFNFTFSLGAGFDFFRRPNRSMRFEYRLQHLSNASIGAINPGIDSQMMHVGYSWGR
ncbi:MAG: acyloxyacyl hydrolase [Silvibacterium sp.]